MPAHDACGAAQPRVAAPERDDQQVLLGAIKCFKELSKHGMETRSVKRPTRSVKRRLYCQAALLQVNGHLQGAAAAAL
jgi:hypothetical protein